MNPILKRAYEFSHAGGVSMVEQHLKRNKLLVRSRINKLIDQKTDFFELSPLAGYKQYEGEGIPSAGLVTGIGIVEGRRCLIVANDATVKGGTLFPLTVKKQIRAMEIAMQRRIPCLYLVDSGGAFLPLQREIFPDKNMGGRTFFLQARMSSLGIPQLAAIMGSCTAGAAYVPAMSDETIIVNKTGTVFLGGPPLVKAATGEIVTAEELGGATVHCEKSGLTDYFCNDDSHALNTMRRMVAQLDSDDDEINRRKNLFAEKRRPNKSCPKLAQTEGQDIRTIVSHIVDDNFQEFKQKYDGKSILTGYGTCGGFSIGVIATQGEEISYAALSKASHFVQLCEKRGYPLVFFTRGAFPNHSSLDLIKAGARFGQSVACAKVPKITFNIGPISGWTSTFFGSRSFDPTFLFSWPNSYVAIEKEEKTNQIDESVSALRGSSNLEDDGIILPEETKRVLFDALSICLENCNSKNGVNSLDVHYMVNNYSSTFGVFRM